MNVQALTTPDGELVYLGRARPGSTPDIFTARADGIVDVVTAVGVETTADSGYQGAGGTVRTDAHRFAAGEAHALVEDLADGGTGLAAAADLLLADLVQNYGLPEIDHLTRDGAIRLDAWQGPPRDAAARWADETGLERVH